MRSQCSELINELGSCEIVYVIDLQFFVDLELGLDEFLVISVSKLELVLGAVVWNVIHKANFIVVDPAFLEVKIVHGPSGLITGHFCFECCEIGVTLLVSCSSLSTLSHDLTSGI